MVLTVIKFIAHKGSIFTEHINKPEQWTEAWVTYQFINHAAMASALTHIAGEIYQVMQKMQGLLKKGLVADWAEDRGTNVRDEENVMSIWAKREQLMKRLAFTKCNHGICQVIKSESNPSSLNQNNIHSQPLFRISDIMFFYFLASHCPNTRETLKE